MASSGRAGQVVPSRRTDVLAACALVLSIFCSAGVVHLEFRLHCDRQLMSAGGVVFTGQPHTTVSLLADERGSDGEIRADYAAFDKTPYEEQETPGTG